MIGILASGNQKIVVEVSGSGVPEVNGNYFKLKEEIRRQTVINMNENSNMNMMMMMIILLLLSLLLLFLLLFPHPRFHPARNFWFGLSQESLLAAFILCV